MYCNIKYLIVAHQPLGLVQDISFIYILQCISDSYMSKELFQC